MHEPASDEFVKNNIKVFARLKPLDPNEFKLQEYKEILVLDEQTISLHNHIYKFDRVFSEDDD